MRGPALRLSPEFFIVKWDWLRSELISSGEAAEVARIQWSSIPGSGESGDPKLQANKPLNNFLNLRVQKCRAARRVVGNVVDRRQPFRRRQELVKVFSSFHEQIGHVVIR